MLYVSWFELTSRLLFFSLKLWYMKINWRRFELTWGYNSCFSVDRKSRSECVGVLWKSLMCCTIMSYSINYIEVDDATRGKWCITSFYGCLERHRKRFSWGLIRTLRNVVHYRCFNDMLGSSDKKEELSSQLGLLMFLEVRL